MAANFEGARNVLGLAWKEIASWGSGVDFSTPDYLRDRVDQLENCLARAKGLPSDSSIAGLGAESLEPCR